MPLDPSLWKTVALLSFFLIFVGVVIWTYLVGRTNRFQHDAGLPLDEGRPVRNSHLSTQEDNNV